MSALTLLIVLAFAAVLAALLAIWFTLTLPTRAAEMQRRANERPEPAQRRPAVSNDAVRGAKAPRKSMPLDATPRRKRSGGRREAAGGGDMPSAPTGPRSPRERPSNEARPRPDEADRPRRPEGDPFDRFLEKRGRDDF